MAEPGRRVWNDLYDMGSKDDMSADNQRTRRAVPDHRNGGRSLRNAIGYTDIDGNVNTGMYAWLHSDYIHWPDDNCRYDRHGQSR